MKNRNIPACNAVALRAGIFTTILMALSFFALSQGAQAVSPAPDGGYPNRNTAEGTNALFSLATGVDDTAIGFDALRYNTSGYHNTATGSHALYRNTTGRENTATGSYALWQNTIGYDNTATGVSVLQSNTTGYYNTATGAAALDSNTTGRHNTATGFGALSSNTTGHNNTATGVEALLRNTFGHDNTAIGANAGDNQTTGSNNVYIGAGINGTAGESNACRIASIFGQTAASGSAVFVTSGHKLGTMTSSVRFKDEIKPMDKASEAILALKPVTFRYKKEIDPDGRPQFGLVAEEVEKVNPDLIVRDKEGKPYSVRYDQVNAMLLNEFLKEHKKVQEQQTTIGQLKSNAAKQEAMISELKEDLQTVVARLKDQDSKIQSVSAELEIMKRLPQVVATNP